MAASSVGADRSDLQQRNGPSFAFRRKDERHTVHRLGQLARHGHVLPHDAGQNSFGRSPIKAVFASASISLRVRSQKHFKLFFDLCAPGPELSCVINEL